MLVARLSFTLAASCTVTGTWWSIQGQIRISRQLKCDGRRRVTMAALRLTDGGRGLTVICAIGSALPEAESL